MDEFLHRMEMLMSQKRLTRKQLAAEAGLNPSTVHGYWSKRRYPKAEDLVQIARVLQTSSEYLILGSNFQENKSLSRETHQLAEMLEKLSAAERSEVLTIIRTYSLLYMRRGIDLPLIAAEKPDKKT